jgi:hypothetical protein
MAEYSKRGQGAFDLEIAETDKQVRARRGDESWRSFSDPQRAYDHYRHIHDATGDHAAWNICYHLEDFLHHP